MELNTRNDTQEMEHLELFAKDPVITNIQLLFKNYDELKRKNKKTLRKYKGKDKEIYPRSTRK
jgi:hypothetical protein